MTDPKEAVEQTHASVSDLLRAGRLGEAAVIVGDDIATLRQQLLDALETRVSIRVELGAWQEALNDLDEALELCARGAVGHDQLGSLRGNRGWVLIRLGRVDEGKAEIEHVIQMGTNDPAFQARLYLNRGLALSRGGDKSGALADYDRAQAAAPYDPLVYYDRACVLAETGQLDDALGNLTTSVQLDQTIRLDARHDPDFDGLRSSAKHKEAFKALVGADD